MRFSILRILRSSALTVLTVGMFFAFQLTASADDYAYEVTSSAQFGIIDLTTGVFVPIGNSSVAIIGLGVHNGTLYGVYGNTLYRVSLVNGILTPVGNAPFVYRGFGSTMTGLYGFDQNMNLYSINPTNGAATSIGSTGLSNPGGLGVSTGSATLYITPTQEGSQNTELYWVDTTTGAANFVGYTGFYGSGASVLVNGTLYAGVFSPLAVYTLNTQTGQGMFVASVSGTTSYFYGLAPLPPTAPCLR